MVGDTNFYQKLVYNILQIELYMSLDIKGRRSIWKNHRNVVPYSSSDLLAISQCPFSLPPVPGSLLVPGFFQTLSNLKPRLVGLTTQKWLGRSQKRTFPRFATGCQMNSVYLIHGSFPTILTGRLLGPAVACFGMVWIVIDHGIVNASIEFDGSIGIVFAVDIRKKTLDLCCTPIPMVALVGPASCG